MLEEVITVKDQPSMSSPAEPVILAGIDITFWDNLGYL